MVICLRYKHDISFKLSECGFTLNSKIEETPRWSNLISQEQNFRPMKFTLGLEDKA